MPRGGVRGNKGGAKGRSGRKGRAELSGARALLNEHWSDDDRLAMLRALVAKAMTGDVPACRLVLYYLWGRPTSRRCATCDGRAGNGSNGPALVFLSDATAATINAKLAAALGADDDQLGGE